MRAGFFGQRTDGGAAFADHVTDLLWIDLHGEQLRREVRDFGFGFAHGGLHFFQNVHSRFFGLGQSDLHNFFGNALDLDVHLQRRNTVGGTSHFKVHVAQMIFVTQDVGQHREAVGFFDQAHGDTCHLGFHRNACVHHGQATAADRRHR